MKTIKMTIETSYKSVRKRTPKTGGPMNPKKGRGSYRRKDRGNSGPGMGIDD
jgi:hypothetical protein